MAVRVCVRGCLCVHGSKTVFIYVCVFVHFSARECLFSPRVLMSVRQEIMRASLREPESVPRSCSA